MSAYLIASICVQSTDWLSDYSDKANALITKYGGKYIVRGGAMEALEGESPLPSMVVVLKFPSIEKGKAWYEDEEYKPLIDIRNTGSKSEFVLVEGVGP